MGQVNNRSDVHLHHIQQTRRLNLAKLAVGAEAGIVDQQRDRYALLFGKAKDLGGSLGPSKVSSKGLCLNFVTRTNVVRQLCQPVRAAAGQNQVSTVKRQLLGKCPTDAGTSPRN